MEKEKNDERGRKLLEKIKEIKRQQGERIGLLAVDSGVTELEITDDEWKEVFEHVKNRFQKPKQANEHIIQELPPFEENQ